MQKPSRMCGPIDLAIYTHRWSDYLAPCLESIANTTDCNLNIILVNEPGNVHENMQKALNRRQNRFFCFIDEDVQFLHEGWLDSMLQILHAFPEVGLVGTEQIKDYTELVRWESETPSDYNPWKEREMDLEERRWVPAHVMLMDFASLRGITIDKNIPGGKGMSDLDWCLQIRDRGLKVVKDRHVMVYHPRKPDSDEGRISDQQPTLKQEQEVYPEQVVYMLRKWGEEFACCTMPTEDTMDLVKKKLEDEGILFPTIWNNATPVSE